MKSQLGSFKDRISRIQKPSNQSYRDPETGMMIPKRMSKKIIKAGATGPRKASRIEVMMSVMIGVFCVMGARYVRFQLAHIPDAGTAAETITVMDLGIAAVLAFILGAMLKHATLRHMVAQTAGIAVMIVAMHNLVWLFPSEFAQVYSQDYVEQVQALTSPQSLYLNGATLAFL